MCVTPCPFHSPYNILILYISFSVLLLLFCVSCVGCVSSKQHARMHAMHACLKHSIGKMMIPAECRESCSVLVFSVVVLFCVEIPSIHSDHLFANIVQRPLHRHIQRESHTQQDNNDGEWCNAMRTYMRTRSCVLYTYQSMSEFGLWNITVRLRQNRLSVRVCSTGEPLNFLL